jgi:hypothetical protein
MVVRLRKGSRDRERDGCRPEMIKKIDKDDHGGQIPAHFVEDP